MPTVIVLDLSLSMQRPIPGRSEENSITYHQLALKGITQLLDYLSALGKMEHVAFVTYSSNCEVKVDFTKDYDNIKQAVKKLEPIDKVFVLSMMNHVGNMCSNTWGPQCYCQVVVFTDCGVGFGRTSLVSFIQRNTGKDLEDEYQWIHAQKTLKWNFMCLGVQNDYNFADSINVYQEFINCTGLNGKLYAPKPLREYKIEEDYNSDSPTTTKSNSPGHKSELGRTVMHEMIEKLYENSFKPYEVLLRCGNYFRLETPVLILPPPTWYLDDSCTTCLNDGSSKAPECLTLASKLEICGYIPLVDIGIPGSLGRHIVMPKGERDKFTTTAPLSPFNRKNSDKMNSNNTKANNDKVRTIISHDISLWYADYEKLEQEIREFYSKNFKENDDSVIIIDDIDLTKSPVHNTTSQGGGGNQLQSTSRNEMQESLCVLLHNALRAENSAALVLLNDNWYGFLYSYTDNKKRSYLMLHVLPQGTDVVPWLGDLQMLGFANSVEPTEVSSFPVKSEKRSYSQNYIVWINQSSLQSDVQKVLRHAKKMPEKTTQFYKELNRVRRAALCIGFTSLLEAMATIFEKEALNLTTLNTNHECILQLKHAALELRHSNDKETKMAIMPLQTGPTNSQTYS